MVTEVGSTKTRGKVVMDGGTQTEGRWRFWSNEDINSRRAEEHATRPQGETEKRLWGQGARRTGPTGQCSTKT